MLPTHLAPSAPVPTGRYLSFGEREEIAIELAKGTATRAIAPKLAHSPNTRSHAKCAATPPRAVATSTIAQLQRNGVLTARRDDLAWASWPVTPIYAPMSSGVSRVRSRTSMVPALRVPR